MGSILGENNPTPANQAPDIIKDASIESFEADVISASMTAPVVVDFWADWCGPCKQLAPALEKAVLAAGGKVSLVKVDIDKNQMLASQLRIQSIPTVYAFYQGRPVDGFQGAVPESEIKDFVERLTQLGGEEDGGGAQGIEDYLSAGEAALQEGDILAAAQLFGQAAEADPTNITALAGLARCQLASGDLEQAKQTLELAPPDKQNDAALVGIKASIALAETAPKGGDVGDLKTQSEADPANLEIRFELAGAYIGMGSLESAIDELLAIIERDREWNEEAARKKLLTLFDALGGGHPATLRGRRRLSSILFS